MTFRIKNFNIMGFTKNLIFKGGAYRELRQFVDLREELEEKRV